MEVLIIMVGIFVAAIIGWLISGLQSRSKSVDRSLPECKHITCTP